VNRLPREVVESASLEAFKKRVGMALWTWFSRHGGVGLDDLRGLFQPLRFCDLTGEYKVISALQLLA